MADQHNSNIPAVGNQISADIPDIKENLEFHKDAFQVLFQAWSDSDNSSGKLDSTTAFYDGTYTYTIPTNNVATNALFMIGDTNTVAWFYVTNANGVTGWKAQSSGGGNLLAIGYAAAQYDSTDDGSASSGGWERGDCTLSAAQSGLPAHTHTLPGRYNTQDGNYTSVQASNPGAGSAASPLGNAGTVSAAAASSAHNHGSSWRPTANVGRLYKLDEA